MARKVTKAEYEALASFHYALRQFLHRSEEAAVALGLTPAQHQALLAIKGFTGREGMMVGELAERLQIRPHSAVGLIDRLVGQGLVTRHQGAGDKRQVMVALTPEGGSILEELAASHREEIRRSGPELLEQLRGIIGV